MYRSPHGGKDYTLNSKYEYSRLNSDAQAMVKGLPVSIVPEAFCFFRRPARDRTHHRKQQRAYNAQRLVLCLLPCTRTPSNDLRPENLSPHISKKYGLQLLLLFYRIRVSRASMLNKHTSTKCGNTGVPSNKSCVCVLLI